MSSGMLTDIPDDARSPAATTAPAPKGAGKNRKRKRGKTSSSNRMDSFRESHGSSFEADRRRRIEERTGGFSAEIPLPKLTEVTSVVTPLVAQIPVSSRGIGFSVTICYEKIHSQFPAKVDAAASIFQTFRASLAQVWLVRQRCQDHRGKETLNPDDSDDVLVPYGLQIIDGFKENFSMVANVASSFGWFDHGGSSYWPTIPPTPQYDDGTLMPHSTLVKAEELRSLVLQLADEEVPEEDRRRFRDSNSLPGAEWNDDNLLTNGDVICPEGWPDRGRLRADFLAHTALMKFCQTKAPQLVGTVDYSGRGSTNALVSRRMQYGDSSLIAENGRPQAQFGPLEDFYVATVLDEQPFLRGVLSLAGEWEEPFLPPYRHEPSAVRRVNLDWLRLADRAVE